MTGREGDVVRGLFHATRVAGHEPPFDTIHLKVLYPARLTGADAEKSYGIVAPDLSGAPYPVVVFFGGINVPKESYQWLGESLVRRGVVFVGFDWVSSPMPGQVALTPGLDLSRVRPDTYGRAPTATALSAVLDAVRDLGRRGLLEGVPDPSRIVLGGHSAGGTIALQNARQDWFGDVVAGFSYGAHNAAATMLGHPPGTVLPLGGTCPLMLLGGQADGVIGESAFRYGLEGWDRDPIAQTYDRAGERRAGARYLALLRGAGHFLVTDPHDETTGRGFLEPPRKADPESRALLADLIGDFVEAHAHARPDARHRLESTLTTEHPALTTASYA